MFDGEQELRQVIDRDGFFMLREAVDRIAVDRLINDLQSIIQSGFHLRDTKTSKGHVYAARNLIERVPLVSLIWNSGCMFEALRIILGEDFGLVRALFFDKPPERTWSLPWHKDTSIAVKDNSLESEVFTKPTLKAEIPHVIAQDDVLRQMLTLRIHLDDVTEENGPLRVIPGSHVSSSSKGVGVERAITIYASAGDVLVMRPLISHASGESFEGTKRHRRILHLEFAASAVLPDGFEWHIFLKPKDSLGV